VLCVENMSVLEFVPGILSASKQFVGCNEIGFELFTKFIKDSDRRISCQDIN